MKNKILLAFLIILLFLEGIWFDKITFWLNHFLINWFVESSVPWIHQFANLLIEKVPVITENLIVFILGFLHLLLTFLCLKIYFSWQFRPFIKLFFMSYLIFLGFSIALIYAYIWQVRFFQVWKDFKELFFSPFPLIFIYLICKLAKKK